MGDVEQDSDNQSNRRDKNASVIYSGNRSWPNFHRFTLHSVSEIQFMEGL